MPLLKLIFLLCFLFLSIYSIDKQSYVLQRPSGVWSSALSAFPQQNSKNLPAQYYLCGFQLKLKPFSYNAQDCNCGRRWYRWRLRWRCNWCTHTYNWKTNGLNSIFCSYRNWTEQKQVKFDTQDSTNVGYGPKIMCPQGTYAKSINGGFGWQVGGDMGFNGLSLDCQPISQSKSIQVSYSLTNQWTSWGIGKNGYFVSGFKLKYIEKDMLTGIDLIFQAMPEIFQIVLDYNLNGVQYQPFVIERKQIQNNGSQTIQSSQTFTKQLRQQKNFQTTESYKRGYMISSQLSLKQKSTNGQISFSISSSIYQERTSTFSFGEDYTSTWVSTQSIMILVPPFKKVTVDQVVYQKNVNLPFTAYVTFRNRITKQVIGKAAIQGIYNGVDFQKIVTKLQQTYIAK